MRSEIFSITKYWFPPLPYAVADFMIYTMSPKKSPTSQFHSVNTEDTPTKLGWETDESVADWLRQLCGSNCTVHSKEKKTGPGLSALSTPDQTVGADTNPTLDHNPTLDPSQSSVILFY